MPRYFKSEPGVVRLNEDGSATMTTGLETWEVTPEEVLFDEHSPEITVEEYNKSIAGMIKARKILGL